MKITKTKKILLILLCALLIFGIAKRNKLKRYFSEEYLQRTLLKLNLLKCYNPGADFIEIFNQEGFDYKKLNQEAIENSLKKLSDKNFKAGPLPKIPTITHKMYFTPANKHTQLKDFYIEEMRVNYNKLNDLSVGNWQHNIWVNQDDLIPEDIKNIKGVKVRNISELKNHPSYSTIIDLLEKGNSQRPYFAQAADLTRLVVVQKFGGIYSDMDYEIYNPRALFELMEKFDFMIAREHWAQNSYYGNAFIAAKANHPIINQALEMSLRNYKRDEKDPSTPDYIKYPCNGYDELYFNGPPLVTIAYFAKNNIDGNSDVILPPWMIFNVGLIRQEYQTYDLSSITKNIFYQRYNNSSKLVEEFMINPQILKEQQADLLDSSKLSENIFYNLKNRAQFSIIGADMFCGSWTEGGKTLEKKYHWKLPW